MYSESDRRRMGNYLARTLASCASVPRRRVALCLGVLIVVVFTIAVWHSSNVLMKREQNMELKLINMENHLKYLMSMYESRLEEVMTLKDRIDASQSRTSDSADSTTAISKTNNGTRAASGLQGSNIHLRTSFVFQLLPHLMANPHSLRPAYHMRGSRDLCDFVVGIPTVKRDKENYLHITLEYLIAGLSKEEMNSTLIIVFVGETDLDYVYRVAREVQNTFPNAVDSGLIEVISPHPSYYPDIEAMTPTLGDSAKRFRWRTKQNLDNLYLMAYARTKGTYYLMLEDDVLCTKNYMKEIKSFTASVSLTHPNWFFIEYCPVGGIGKLFRSADLLHFITYVQLFYSNLPIDWLLESYLSDRVCTIERATKTCAQNKLEIRPKFKSSLFEHIGLFSSLKGKISKVKDAIKKKSSEFHPHLNNPVLEKAETDIKEHGQHSLMNAYLGINFFWGVKPQKGNSATFTFPEPIVIDRYFFRSGNPEHVTDKFLWTVVEALPARATNYTEVGSFDEFGLAEGSIKDIGPVKAVRLRVMKDLAYWVILSEIELVPSKDDLSTTAMKREVS